MIIKLGKALLRIKGPAFYQCTVHGPNEWTWKLFSFTFARLYSVYPPSFGWNLWIYYRRAWTRPSYGSRAIRFEIVFDRRSRA